MIADGAVGGVGYPLKNVTDGLGFQGGQEKIRHEHFGIQKRAAQFNLARRGQRQRWMGNRTCRRKSRLGNTSTNGKKGYEGRNGPQTGR